jgi:fused signal recognition particle receptor
MSWFFKKKESELAPAAPAAEPSLSWLERLKGGLSKTSSNITGGISDIFTKRKLDQEALDALEELLIISDMGVKTSSAIIAELKRTRLDKDISPEEVKAVVSQHIEAVLAPVALPLAINTSHKPHVILVCGVNGNGKTTTIGKLAKLYTEEGKKVMIAACDTFRAAAVEQLAVWAKRSDTPLIQGTENADPASVAYTALEQAKANGVDILLIDTAGRLHNKTNLMQELNKIIRVLTKLDVNAPHDTVLVLDATTGQNAHSQVRTFKEAAALSGLIITKLDGTAKGGVVVGLAKEFGLPIHAIGVGESIDDLRPFEAKAFAEGLLG